MGNAFPARGTYPTQAGAELAAREVVMRDKAELLIHSHTGQIRDRPAYTRHDRATSPADRAELDPYRRPPPVASACGATAVPPHAAP